MVNESDGVAAKINADGAVEVSIQDVAISEEGAVSVSIQDAKINADGALEVSVQDAYNTLFNLYAQLDTVNPVITVDTALDDTVITIDDNTGIVDGDAITITEGTAFYQSLVQSSTDTTITLASPLDYAFTTAATVSVGTWNMAVDGSSTSQVFCITPPAGIKYDIVSINISITDNTTMDGITFGGITQLTNGIVLRTVDGITKNHFVIVNNIGFDEHGYSVVYDPKPPTGSFRVRARKILPVTNGAVIRLNGDTGDALCLIVRDDLSDLTLMSLAVSGHIVKD